MSRKGRYDVDSFEEKLTEAEKDGHHLLFKFNEVCSILYMFVLKGMVFRGLVPSSTGLYMMEKLEEVAQGGLVSSIYLERNMLGTPRASENNILTNLFICISLR